MAVYFYLLYYWSDIVCSLADIEICVDSTYWYGFGCCANWWLDYDLLLGIDPAWCWLITSVIGAVLCVDATVRLNSRPLAYVSLLSMFTMTTSLPAVVHAQLVWYYVVMLLLDV